MPKKFLKPTFPDLIVMEYGKALVKEMSKIDSLTKEILYPHLARITNTKEERFDEVKFDAELKELFGIALVAELIRRIKSKFYGEFLGQDQEPSQRLFSRSLRRISKPFMDQTKKFTEERFVREFERQIDSLPAKKSLDVKELVDEATTKSVSLSKAAAQRHFSQLQSLMDNSVDGGKTVEELKTEIENIFGKTENSARLVARDQTGKLVASSNESRSKKLGLDFYIWRTMGDSVVRSFANSNGRTDHARLDGTLQRFSDPPIVVFKGKRAGTRLNAGFDFGCRCFAQPVFDAITGVMHPSTIAAMKKAA